MSNPRADQKHYFQSVVKLQSYSVQLFYALKYEFEESFDEEPLNELILLSKYQFDSSARINPELLPS